MAITSMARQNWTGVTDDVLLRILYFGWSAQVLSSCGTRKIRLIFNKSSRMASSLFPKISQTMRCDNVAQSKE